MVPFRLLPLTAALAVASACWAEDAPSPYKPADSLAMPVQTQRGPVFFEADHVTGLGQDNIVAEGNVSARTQDERFYSDWLHYDANTDEITAKGHVVAEKGADRIECDNLQLKLSSRMGEAKPAHFFFTSEKGQPGRGDADVLFFEGPNRYRLEQVRFTTCPVNDDDWYLKTSTLNLDYNDNIGSARNIRVEYLGVPILYAPTFSFALDQRRKSGFLSPSYGASNNRGVEIITPWYWNIAPNMDATFTPRYMSQRGLQIGTQYRYLEPTYSGTVVLEALPHDNKYGSGRYREYVDHRQQFSPRLSGTVHLEDVSDDTYFADLSSLISETSQQNLPRQATLSYNGSWWNVRGLVQAYQTLQDPAAPVTPPYRRLPQILFNGDQHNLLAGLGHFNLRSEVVHFDIDPSNMAIGTRFYAYPTFDLSVEEPYGFIRPKIGWSYTHYNLSRNPDHPDALSITRSMPTFSLDTGIYLDRNLGWHGGKYVQTLEPRLFYVRIPYRDQSAIPVFDTGAPDPLQPQLYAENQYIGIDRINDANQLTAGITSRFIESATGLERLQVTLGQRYYFNSQRVVLPGYIARSSNTTNLLAQTSGQVTDQLRINSSVQYSTRDKALAQADIGFAYRAGPGKLLNADARYTNPLYGTDVKQIDLSWQWPIKSRWYSLGRLNYSFVNRRLVAGLIGFEYNAGCWITRAVVQKVATTSLTSSTMFFLQLELRGLTRLGPNPLDALRNNIPGYTLSNELERP